jgi:hypothetical protein
MAQQPLGIVALVGSEGECRKTAQSRDVAGIFLQDLPNNPLRSFPIIGHEGGRCFLNPGSLGIGEARALESHARVGVLLEIDQHVAVGQPCKMVMRRFLQHPPYLLSRLCSTSVTPVGARQIHPRECKVGEPRKQRLESRDALGDLALVQQGDAEEPKAIRISGVLSIQHAKSALGTGGTAGTQRCVRLAKAFSKRGVIHVVDWEV